MNGEHYRPPQETVIPEGATTFDELQHVLKLPRVIRDSQDIYSDGQVLMEAVVECTHMALEKGDFEEYKKWQSYLTDVAATPDGHLVAKPARLEIDFLAGAVHATPDGAVELEADLTHDPDLAPDLIALCAQYNIPPASWIERYSANDDAAAQLWDKYFTHRTARLARAHEPYEKPDLFVPGAEQFFEIMASSQNITPKTQFEQSQLALEISKDVLQKNRIAHRFTQSIVKLNNDGAIAGNNENLICTGTAILNDPDINPILKANAASLIDFLRTGEGLQSLNFAITRHIVLESADVSSTLTKIDEICQQTKASNRDILLRAAARTFARNGYSDNAADLISPIDRFGFWIGAVENYLSSGGDAHLVLDTDNMHRTFETVPENEAESSAKKWRARELAMTYLQNMQAGSYQQAAHAVGCMLQEAPQGTANWPASNIITPYIQRLLRHDLPDETKVALAECLRGRDYPNKHELYSLFVQHGAVPTQEVRHELGLDRLSHIGSFELLQHVTIARAATARS